MLNNLKLNFYRVKYILDSNKFKAIFLIILITCIFNLFNITGGISYEEAIFASVTNTLFLFVLISLLFVSSCLVVDYFDKDYSTLLRFKNKSEYLKNLFISIIISNLIIYVLSITVVILLITIKYFGVISFKSLSYYDIPYVIYNCFTIIKYFVFINIISIIGVCVYKNIGKIVGYIYYFLILLLYYTFPVSGDIIGKFSLKNLFFKYYIFPYQYANFHLEISSTIITMCILFLLIAFLFYITIKYNKIKIDE